MPLIFPAFRFLDSITSYGHSKGVIELGEFKCPHFSESRNVNISISYKQVAVTLPGNHLQPLLIRFEIERFSISFMSEEYISLQAPYSIFVDRSARFGQLITRFLAHAFHNDFIYRSWHDILLRMPFISF
jgi:hypothetical protein